MKTIYWDVVLTTNFITDYTLLFLCAKFMHIKQNKLRICISALVGAVFALLSEIFTYRAGIKLALTFLFYPLMCVMAFGFKRKKLLIRITVVFVVFSMLLWGFVSVWQSISVMNNSLNGGISLWMIFAGVALMCVTFFVFGKTFTNENIVKTVEIKIKCCGKCRNLTLLCDSGNLLTDPYSDLPVIILGNDFTSSFDSDESFVKCKTRYIPVKTAEGNGVIKAVKPEMLEIINGKTGTRIDAVVGFAKNKNADYGGTDGIIPYCLVDNL